MRQRILAGIILKRAIITACVAFAGMAQAAVEVAYTQLFTSATPLSNGEPIGFEFPSPLYVDGTSVVFAGFNDGYPSGVYRYSSGTGIQTIAAGSTQSCGDYSPSGHDGYVSYCRNGSIFRFNPNGSVTRIMPFYAPIPGGGNFGLVGGSPRSIGTNVLFWGGDFQTGRDGIYFGDGTQAPTTFVDESGWPGHSFLSVGESSIAVDAAGNIAFGGIAIGGLNQGQYSGIFRGDLEGNFETVADTNTTIPGGTGKFTGVGGPSISGTNVAFSAEGNGVGTGQGVYSTYGGLHVVADTTTPIPQGTGTFRILSSLAAGEDFTIFYGDDQDYHGGIFIESNGVIEKILDGSVNFLNGHMVLNTGYIANVDGNRFAFAATEPDGGMSVWLAQVTITSVPLPAVGWLLGPAFGLIGWKRRKSA